MLLKAANPGTNKQTALGILRKNALLNAVNINTEGVISYYILANFVSGSAAFSSFFHYISSPRVAILLPSVIEVSCFQQAYLLKKL